MSASRRRRTCRFSRRCRLRRNRSGTCRSWSSPSPGSSSSWSRGCCSTRIVRFRARAAGETTEPPQVYGSKPIEIAWTAAPALIVFILILVTIRTLWEVNVTPPPAPGPADQPLIVTVVGRQWWWEYRYESYDGRPLGFIDGQRTARPGQRGGRRAARLSDAQVGRRLPQLLGAAAGREDRPDPRPHQLMWFQTETARPVPRPVRRILRHAARQHADPRGRRCRRAISSAGSRPQASPARGRSRPWRAGKAAFLAQSCVNCHRVRGTPARGTYAPDLTHLMSRQTLAVGDDPEHARRTCAAGWTTRSRSSRAA